MTDSRLGFEFIFPIGDSGAHAGKTMREVAKDDPGHLFWALSKYEWLRLHPDVRRTALKALNKSDTTELYNEFQKYHKVQMKKERNESSQ